MTHGTDAGYWRHHRTGEDACGPCKAAHSAYVTENRNRRKVRELPYDNPYTREADAALAANPPVIVWRQKPGGIRVHVEINDPHADREHYTQRKAAS